MKVIATIFILAGADYTDESCSVGDGACLLQLRTKVEDLEAGLEHANHDAAYWKKRMELLKLRRSEIKKGFPPCAECPKGSDLCEGQEHGSAAFGMEGGADVHMCRHDASGALCAYECERTIVLTSEDSEETTDELATALPTEEGDWAAEGEFGGGVSGPDEDFGSTTESDEIPECPGQDQHLDLTSPDSCEKHGAVMRAKDGTNLEDYFWDNVRIKEVNYKVDGETLETHKQMNEYNFTKKPAGDNSPHHVEVMVKDVGNFEVMCRRDVYVYDKIGPQWKTSPERSLTPHMIEFLAGEDCSRTADELFTWYEQNRSVTWDPVAEDNCQGVDGQAPLVYREVYIPKVNDDGHYVEELVYSENPDMQPATEVYTFIGEQFLMLKYYAVDASGTPMDSAEEHKVNIGLKDNIAPTTDDVFCPSKFHVTLLHNETTATVQWSLPRVVSDNCPPKEGGRYPYGIEEARAASHGAFPALKETSDKMGRAALVGHFEPGTYEVDYTLKDSNGNLYPHECEMIIEVEQYASPVHLECPDEVPVAITGKKNYAPVAWQEPDHNNGKAHQDNNPVNVTYKPAGVVPGMAFPWGTTTITVVATGSGSVADASHNVAECSFVVNVSDERPPELWGKQYHCRKLANGDTAPGAAPYRLCEAQKHLNVKEHKSYLDTGGYSIEGVGSLPYRDCCDSETQDGTIVSHQCKWESDLISYCAPNEH